MIEYKKIMTALSKYSPLVASAISEMNPMLGVILMALTRAFNTDINSIPTAISMDTNSTDKIKNIENQYYDDLIKYQTENEIDARQRELNIVKLTGKRDGILDFIAIIVVIGFFVLCGINYFIPLRDDHVVIMLIGQISSGFMLCLSYYFGSSNKQ